jgi:hypothetical protein
MSNMEQKNTSLGEELQMVEERGVFYRTKDASLPIGH